MVRYDGREIAWGMSRLHTLEHEHGYERTEYHDPEDSHSKRRVRIVIEDIQAVR
jgi:hypothetical protein